MRQVIASRRDAAHAPSKRRLQVLDDGNRLMAYVDGEPLAQGWIVDSRLHDETKVGFLLDGAVSLGPVDLEAHPRQVMLPQVLEMGAPWFRKGTQEVIADDFSGARGDLEGRQTPVGGKQWHRLIGSGVFEVTGRGSAAIQGTPQRPCPGRTAYCIDWPHPEFVDLEVTVTPPDEDSDKRAVTTAGFILYQDAENYVTLNAFRSSFYPAGSVSTFFKFNGFEDVYDAIWSNVGDRILYGKPTRLRLTCDGERYLVFLNDETVLYRAFRDVYPDLKRLVIRKVGLVANWEFGTDTGSKFEQLRMRV